MIYVNSVSVYPKTIKLKVGDWYYDAYANVLPQNADSNRVTWHSTDASIANVNPSNGYIYAIADGTTKIYATATDGSKCSDYITVTVGESADTTPETTSSNSQTMLTGEFKFLHTTESSENSANNPVVWSSSDTSVATVNPDSGLVCAGTAGTAVISATARDSGDVVETFNLSVTSPILVTHITIREGNHVVNKGGTLALLADVHPINATNNNVRWFSENPLIATVESGSGLVTGISMGTATIVAMAQDGSEVETSCTVTVAQTTLVPEEETPTNSIQRSTAAGPVDAYAGAHMLSEILMPLFGGQGLKLTAHYNSSRLVCGSLGTGWYHNFEKHIEVDGSNIYVYSNPASFSRYTASNDDHSSFTCCSPDKNGYVLTVDNSSQYPYVINCNSARTEYYNADGNLSKITDHQGFETLISYSNNLVTITDTVSGKSIHLEKDSEGKVVRVYDDTSRQVILTYTDCLLTSICDVNGKTRIYSYDEDCRIKSGANKNESPWFTNSYDCYGRLLEQKDAKEQMDAMEHITKFAYDDTNGTRTVTNRNNDQSSYEYNSNGLLIKYTDENGYSTTYEYDSRYNLTKETDALGYSITKVYNSFNKPTEVTDKNGNVTRFEYDGVGNVTKITYPAIDNVTPTETFEYNSRNQIERHTDRRGTVTVYTYDTVGMPASKKVGSRNAITYSYENGLLMSQKDAMNYYTTYGYNHLGQMTSKTDDSNSTITYTYDNLGHLLTTTDSHNKSIINVYDQNYQKTSVTDANGNKTEYSYNGNRLNDKIKLPDGNTIQYEFDNEGRVTKIIDQVGKITQIAYDKVGRVYTKTLPDNIIFTYYYDKVGNLTTEITPRGATITRTYDKVGNLLSVKDHYNNITGYEYNAMSKVTKVTNAVAGYTEYKYSPAGDLLSETDYFGNKKSYTYDPYGNRLTVTDAKKNVTTYTYDANNNMTSVKDAMGNTTSYMYNHQNLCLCVTDALNNMTCYVYDALGRATSVTDARGYMYSMTYDGNGNLLKKTGPNGVVISETSYNCLNLPFTVKDAMGKVTTYEYNELGKVKKITYPCNYHTWFTYDSCGRTKTVSDEEGAVSTASYDGLGNVTRLAGPLGASTTYSRDEMGRIEHESIVSDYYKEYTYNELNLPKTVTLARGVGKTYEYDKMGKMTKCISPEGSTSFKYDENGNVVEVSDRNGTIKREYDNLNRVKKYTDTYGKTIEYTYDAVGNLSRLTYPDNTAVTYAYDANRNLISVTDWANRVTSYTYDAHNRVTGVTKPDGSVTTTVYDNKNRVTSTVERTASGAIISGFEYKYDDMSRIVEEKVLAKCKKICYHYDTVGKVLGNVVYDLCTGNEIASSMFSYDAAGNMALINSQYDRHNKLISFNGRTLSYDYDGNLTNNGQYSFSYDSSNRLTGVEYHSYTYNAEDVRIRMICECGDTTYTYNTNCKLSQLLTKTTDGITTKYVYGNGLIGEETCCDFLTYHFDNRGSTVAVTDECGNITDTFEYSTYGEQTARTGTNDIIFCYNGRDGVITDSNGLLYMRARYYSPEMGRFINADIIPGEITNAITLNRYAFANGNPVSFVDPTGLLVGALVAGGLLLGGLLIGLTSSSKKQDSSSSNTVSTNSSNATSNNRPANEYMTMEQARSAYLSGMIDELPDQYSYEPSVRAKYKQEQEKQKVNNSALENGTDWDKVAARALERSIDEALDTTIDWGAPKIDKWAGFRDLIVPDRTPPSVYINATTKAFSTAQTIYGFYDVVKENYVAGSPWQETVSDVGIEVVGLGWDTAWGTIGVSIGTAIAPGVGTAAGIVIGAVISIGADVFYDVFMAPKFDDYYTFE